MGSSLCHWVRSISVNEEEMKSTSSHLGTVSVPPVSTFQQSQQKLMLMIPLRAFTLAQLTQASGFTNDLCFWQVFITSRPLCCHSCCISQWTGDEQILCFIPRTGELDNTFHRLIKIRLVFVINERETGREVKRPFKPRYVWESSRNTVQAND